MTTSPVPLDVQAHNEKALAPFSFSSHVPELLMAPVFDADDVHWLVASNVELSEKLVWLEINKTHGRYDFQAWEMVPSTNGPIKQAYPPEQFTCRSYDSMGYKNNDAAVCFHQYSLYLALMVANNAHEWGNKDIVKTVVQILAPHIPWLNDILQLSIRLHGPDDALSKMARAMHWTQAWEMGGPSESEHQWFIQPWLRTMVSLTLLDQANDPAEFVLYAFEGNASSPAAYLWISPPGTSSYRTHVLLDECMRPLLVSPSKNQSSIFYIGDHPQFCWGRDENALQMLNLQEWTDCISNPIGHDDRWFRMLTQCPFRKLTPTEQANAASLWAHQTDYTPFIFSSANEELFNMSQWLVEQWGQHQPQLKFVLDALVQLDQSSSSLLPIEGLRQTMVSLEEQSKNPATLHALPLPELDA